MPFTAQEAASIANATLDYFMKGQPLSQAIQDKPLMKAMKSAQKTFPGGKELIRGNVKGDYTTEFMGYSHDDEVSYANPANIKQFSYSWFEIHSGISLTETELKKDGISIVDSPVGGETVEHSGREMTAISNLLQDKFEDMTEGSAQSFNNMCWKDGTQSAKVFPGVQSLVTGTPTTGIIGGIDAAANTWWRNRASLGIAASASNQTLTKTMRSEFRQLRRYGGKPSLILCGSDFIEGLEDEIHEKGTYTQTGFVNNGKNDIGMADISMRGLGTFNYDPTLDDLGLSKYCYMIDPRHLYLMVMDGEDMKKRSPERPAERYVLYRAMTWTGAMICRKRNAHAVYSIA